MYFFNEYNAPYSAGYSTAKIIGGYVYAVGITYNVANNYRQGLVTKTDLDGNIIYQKEYSLQSSAAYPHIGFQGIVGCDNSDVIIYGTITTYTGQHIDDSTSCLMRIDQNGEVVWQKKFSDYNINSIIKVGTENYIVAFYSRTKENYISKCDALGNLTSYHLYGYGFSGSPIEILNKDNNFLLRGSYAIFELDASLTEIKKRVIQSYSGDVTINTVRYAAGYIFLFGTIWNGNSFAAKIKDSDYPPFPPDTTFTASSFPNYSMVYEMVNNNNVYWLGDQGYVKLTHDFQVVLCKDMHTNENNMLVDVTNNELIFVGIEGDTFVARLDLNINNCISNTKQETLNKVDVSMIVHADFDFSPQAAQIPFHDLEVTITDVAATKKKLCEFFDGFDPTDKAVLQSPDFYLQAAGSLGNDSSKGIHLRWALKGNLSQHLPKGNYSTTSHHFNKPDDFVKIYRARYTAYSVTLDLGSVPNQINESTAQKNWIYGVNGKIFHVHFRDTVKYNQVRNSVNPATAPLNFITAYGDSLIEIETKTDLSFKITPVFQITGGANSAKVELLSVEANKITAPKVASLRKEYTLTALNNIALVAENIRSIRFRSINGTILKIGFEFYADFIANTSNIRAWTSLGSYSLTKEDNVAFGRLEPQPGCLQNWLRYNDQAFVNPANYRTRWNGSGLPELERIETSVDRYISLSDDYGNPEAIEIFPFEDLNAAAACSITNPDYDPYIPETGEATGIPVSFLDVLLLGSTDYHNARMLGLGTLDLEDKVFQGQYIYLAEYITYGDLQDGLGPREVQHLYCSLPTSISDQRLPIPVDLTPPRPGRFFDNGYDDSDVDSQDPEQNDYAVVELTEDGYTPDGKTRYYTFYAKTIAEEDYNAPFYDNDNEFIAAQTTYPVFAGMEYRKNGTSSWIKPEMSSNQDFYNIDSTVAQEQANETIEIVIPDPGKPLYSHAVKESGKTDYSSYGINWFSRASASELIHTVTTILTPPNELLPPTNVVATLIQRERPLMLSTASEQSLYDQNPAADKTLSRLTFEYNHAQELIDYHQKNNDEQVEDYFETPDFKEPFADKIQVFFRDTVPGNILGKIKTVTPLTNPLLTEVTTEPYIVLSQGINENIVPQTDPPTYNEVYTPSITSGTEDNYVGSIFLVNSMQYVIQEVDTSGTYPTFIVLQGDASGAMLNMSSGAPTATEILLPEEGALFTVVENMQNLSSWNLPDNLGFTVNIDLTEVHREGDIVTQQPDCTTQTHVEKFRGVFESATITKHREKIDADGDGYFDVNSGDPTDPGNTDFVMKHQGLYKVTFQGYHLMQHSQYSQASTHSNSVEWYNGVVRIRTLSGGRRKVFKVIRTENIGTTADLTVYIEDLTFPLDDAELLSYDGKIIPDDSESTSQTVNYYPGYKLYLYKDDNLGLDKDTTLPQGEEDVRYTIFGLRSMDLKNEFEYDNIEDYFSKFSIPALMFAKAIVEPVQPQKPQGGLYATRPDYFGKSSYTFNTKYGAPATPPSVGEIHKPYAVQFNRASDIQLLSAIFDNTLNYDAEENLIPNTIQDIVENIFMEGEEAWYVDRWDNLLGFDYSSNDPLEDGLFKMFEDKRLPLPDNPRFIQSINTFIDEHNRFYNLTGSNAIPHLAAGFNLNTIVIAATSSNNALRVKDFVKDALLNCFVPLTEIPIVYNYVNGGDYVPLPKKQVVRDRNGNLLKPTDTAFDMAPMMKRLDPPGGQYESQFTDYGLDGASNTKYFYAVREMNNQFKASPYSEILGPISLVNTAPPVAPQIIKVIPVLENRTLGIAPSMQLQINSYPVAQHIAKVSIYRTTDQAAALSVRTMNLVRVVDLELEGILQNSQWIFEDNFEDLSEIPFGDPLFYKLTVSRKIRYNDKDGVTIVDFSPSEASKLIITNVVENYNPVSPVLDYYSEPLNNDNELVSVILHWEKSCYKAKYYLYKMNSQGNWVKIHELQSNDQDIYLPLADTDLESGTITIADTSGNNIYHHFKVIAENTAGMLSREENILTIYIAENWQDIGGIGEMILGNTFIIR